MSRQDDFSRQIEQSERERARQAREKRRTERANRFWSTFLFTENGKPKSGFVIYTFSLSILFLVFYLLGFHLMTELFHSLSERISALWGNLLISLCVTAAVCLIGVLLHRLLPDKRLLLGTHLWLALYVAAAIVTMAILLRGSGAMGEFMVFALWFALIPLAISLPLFFLLYKKDHHPPLPPAEEEEAWKKYMRRR